MKGGEESGAMLPPAELFESLLVFLVVSYRLCRIEKPWLEAGTKFEPLCSRLQSEAPDDAERPLVRGGCARECGEELHDRATGCRHGVFPAGARSAASRRTINTAIAPRHAPAMSGMRSRILQWWI